MIHGMAVDGNAFIGTAPHAFYRFSVVAVSLRRIFCCAVAKHDPGTISVGAGGFGNLNFFVVIGQNQC